MVEAFDAIVRALDGLQAQLAFLGFMVWLTGAIAAGVIADLKGHQGVLYGILSAVISPLFGFLMVTLLADRRKAQLVTLEQRLGALEGGRAAQLSTAEPKTHRGWQPTPRAPEELVSRAGEDRTPWLGILITIGLLTAVIIIGALLRTRG